MGGRLLHEYSDWHEPGTDERMLSSTDGSDDLTQMEQELVGEMMFEETILRNARRKLKDWTKKPKMRQKERWTGQKKPKMRPRNKLQGKGGSIGRNGKGRSV